MLLLGLDLSPKAGYRTTLWMMAVILTVVLEQSRVAAADTPHTTVTNPKASIGVLSNGPDPDNHICTASIIDSPRGNIIVTAAHCVTDMKSGTLKDTVYFTPGYDKGKTPHGTFKSQAQAIYVSPNWIPTRDDYGNVDGKGSPWDVAFVALLPLNGKYVAEAAGASLTPDFNPTLPTAVQVFGYPSDKTQYKNEFYVCDATATAEHTDWEELLCTGIPGGFSGGPWITGGSKVIGVIGGEGQNLKASDPRNFAVRFSAKIRALYDTAVANTVAVNLGYKLGDGPLWKHADLITTGWFTGSKQMDMIVKWSDGEVTLYQGGSTDDPQKPFAGETQMAKSGSIWTYAKGIATIDNVAVVVTWSDGEVSYYGTVDKNGFRGEVQLKAPNSLWADHAYYVAGVGPHLCVVWSDGETSLYRGVSANGLSIEQTLIAPNSVWTNVRSLSGGNWIGSTGFDLLVRWVDGEFTIYGDVFDKGFTDEHQVEAPNGLWKNAIVTAGRGNAILVRWIDGEVSLYPNVDGKLHREIQLVAP
ncbi:trypsin-like serine protease [Cladorrhinum sp. PSN259]|nr:trypsin-like serine protease [Cladorrhinum sp. PSN259]